MFRMKKMRPVIRYSFAASLLSFLAHNALALDVEALYEKLSPSVWVVVPQDAQGVKIGSGSGVVVGREQIITNCHVLKKAKSIAVKRLNTTHTAKLQHADTERDLCILSVTGLMAPAVPIAPLKTA